MNLYVQKISEYQREIRVYSSLVKSALRSRGSSLGRRWGCPPPATAWLVRNTSPTVGGAKEGSKFDA